LGVVRKAHAARRHVAAGADLEPRRRLRHVRGLALGDDRGLLALGTEQRHEIVGVLLAVLGGRDLLRRPAVVVTVAAVIAVAVIAIVAVLAIVAVAIGATVVAVIPILAVTAILAVVAVTVIAILAVIAFGAAVIGAAVIGAAVIGAAVIAVIIAASAL